jgi:hypothetical protein
MQKTKAAMREPQDAQALPRPENIASEEKRMEEATVENWRKPSDASPGISGQVTGLMSCRELVREAVKASTALLLFPALAMLWWARQRALDWPRD